MPVSTDDLEEYLVRRMMDAGDNINLVSAARRMGEVDFDDSIVSAYLTTERAAESQAHSDLVASNIQALKDEPS